MTFALCFAGLGSISAQIQPVYTYNGIGRSFPVRVQLPVGARGESTIQLLAPVTAEVVQKTTVQGGDQDLAKLFPDLWTNKKPSLLYAQLVLDGRKVGPALVLQPMLNPQISRLKADGKTVEFVTDEDGPMFNGFRAYVDKLIVLDTSMGMINGYFGPRLLNKHGFTEHKVDQAWIIDRGRRIEQKRIDDAFAFVKSKGVTFHWGENGNADFDENATKEQLRDYLVALDLLHEFKADCLGWQYQLGLIPLRAPSDFAEGLFNSTCRPESNGDTIACATEADQGNVVPMEMLKRLLKAKGLHQAVMFHDVRWGAEHDGRFLWVLLNSGSCGAYAFNHDPDTLKGVHSYRQPSLYFPTPGGTFAGESLPGAMTWARAYIKNGELWMDVGRGEVVKLPPKVRDSWWEGTTREWPFMAADMGISRDTLMAHYLSNHVAVAYGDVFGEMVALSQELGFRVRVLGRRDS